MAIFVDMKRLAFLLATAAAVLTACTEKYTDYVDPLIGSGEHGHVFVGANVPFGFVQLGPTSLPSGWDWCSGYNAADSSVIGFSHTHLSGTGCGDLLDVTLMPVVGNDLDYSREGIMSYADRTQEVARPGYYSVPLERYGILAECTATSRVGFSRFTFPESDESAIILDLKNGGLDTAYDVMAEPDGDCKIYGYRFSEGWANDQRIFFVAEFSRPYESFEEVGDKHFRVNFTTGEGDQIMVKVALSSVCIQGAQDAMDFELPEWDFEQAVENADEEWNLQLSKVEVKGRSLEDKVKFYTALYHTMFSPSEFCDINGDYFGADAVVHTESDFTNYTTLSLWDTYRAQMPLFTILHPEREDDIVNTFIHIQQEQGFLPIWHLMGCETYCMVGNPGIPPVADAILKGFTGFNMDDAYNSLTATAMNLTRGQSNRVKYGYIPSDIRGQSVACDMEYAIADWAVAQTALKLGNHDDAAYFGERSLSYRNYIDPETGFARPKDRYGRFISNFNPYLSDQKHYTEGNAWQYTFLAPHDVPGLIKCLGGTDAFLKKLDSLFEAPSTLDGAAPPDMSGMIGQYVHGNEPSHHIIYLYTMAGQPWKTAEKVREVMSELYGTGRDGLCGNEDCGQMSAWFVLSAFGFYQVEPAGGRYWFGSPLFDSVTLNLTDGNTFKIRAFGNGPENKYIQAISLNGQPYDKQYIDYADIMAGGTLCFWMGPEPKK